MTQLKVTPRLDGLAARGFNELDERQIDLVDTFEVNDNGSIPSQGGAELVMCLSNICNCHITDKRNQVVFGVRQQRQPPLKINIDVI